MKYGKIIEKLIAHRSTNKAQVAVALVAGLAAGAVVSILFAPDRGATTRRRLASGAKNLSCGFQDKYSSLIDKVFGCAAAEEEIIENDVPHFVNKPTKKRKSDLKDIVEQAHQATHDQENQQEESTA